VCDLIFGNLNFYRENLEQLFIVEFLRVDNFRSMWVETPDVYSLSRGANNLCMDF
jgi:hypothetical protein